MLRLSSLAKLKEPVVDTVIKFSEFFADWLNRLSQVLGVTMSVEIISGNHDEIRMLQQKSYSAEENFAKLVAEYIKRRHIWYNKTLIFG